MTAWRSAVLAAAFLVSASSDRAAAEAGPQGCFERVYDPEHLRRNPTQRVRRLIVRVGRHYSGDITFGAEAWIRGMPQSWRAGGPCSPAASGWTCQPDTDGDPVVTLAGTGQDLLFTIPDRLKMVDDRTGPDLNETIVAGAGDRTFRLAPAPDKRCRRE